MKTTPPYDVLARRAPKNSGAHLFWQTVLARAYPRVIGQQREKSWMFFDVVLPIIGVAAYVFVYRAIQAPEEYVGFVVVGGAMTAFWLNILWSMSSQLYWEKETGNLALYIIAPNSLMAILLGMALGGLLATTLRAVVILVLGSWLFHVQYAVVHFGQLVAIFFLSMVALYGMGMMFASLFLLLSREAWHISNLAQEPVYLISGFYFPVKSLNFWVATAASLIPLTLGLDAMRQLVFPSGATLGFLSVRLELGILIGLCVIFLLAARFLLNYMERLAIREGRLTENRR
ncbi:MAG: ABC transporter permease [Ardenticatenaceae bacterium]|nr:ABC transporter permease [Anaerolineales bacterium]MCB8920585.1 ABC transporter permease [Ardenticatenaceae bacterium]MCB8990209.1 ABC transporter permease [Ardenticatenaceae bacterium]MCB9002999.1 ABC transporter permease [Ardenticatenaceae bacterium]